MRPLNFYIALFASFSLISLTNCKKEYNPPAQQNNRRLLVVDGFLTNAPDSTFITLTRSRNIADTGSITVESDATLMVESELASSMSLQEIRPGVYGGLIATDSSQKYRLVIRTSGGVHYRSDFIPFRITPEIDSIGWKEDSTIKMIPPSSGVQII
jgi:Domain of unknown function (DUF4249)